MGRWNGSFVTLAGSLLAVVFAGCAAATQVAAPPVKAVMEEPKPATPPVAESIPLERGDIPDGWKLDGPIAAGVQFSKGDAAIQFIILRRDGYKAVDMMKMQVASMAAKKGVTIIGQVNDPSGNEGELAFEDARIGVKHGRLVIRCFPDKTVMCVMTAGIWPVADDAQSSKDFDTFLAWVRTE